MATRDALQEAFERACDDDFDVLYRAGVEATGVGRFELVRNRIAPLMDGAAARDARLWQVLGLAERGLQDAAAAHDAFARAAELAPRDPLIAHSHARTALEAGYEAVELFARAQALRPDDGELLLGRAAAQFAEGMADRALTDLAELLIINPRWLAGHMTYAQLAAASGSKARAFETIDAALARDPGGSELHRTKIRLHMEADDHAAARAAAEAAIATFGHSGELDEALGIALSESGECAAAQAIFAALPAPAQASSTIWRVRTLIRLGRIDEAIMLAEFRWKGHADLLLWPYRALLWRLVGDARWEWLEGDARLIGVFDLAEEIGPIAVLADRLRAMHQGKGQPLDQSLRGGSQTDGVLLARAEPDIRRLRGVILKAVAAHVAQLPPPTPDHPTLLATRAPLRLAGSWSVRLSGSGFHVDHVHPMGWLSSALYVALPGEMATGASDPHNGWLTFGENHALLPELSAFRLVEPRPGRLVLFPSTMWHGTRPFVAGERLTVAFDVARPDVPQ